MLKHTCSKNSIDYINFSKWIDRLKHFTVQHMLFFFPQVKSIVVYSYCILTLLYKEILQHEFARIACLKFIYSQCCEQMGLQIVSHLSYIQGELQINSIHELQ